MAVVVAILEGREAAEGHRMSSVEFCFSPGDCVLIIVCGVNYRGRVSDCRMTHGGRVYCVEYVDDTGSFKDGVFREDELRLLA